MLIQVDLLIFRKQMVTMYCYFISDTLLCHRNNSEKEMQNIGVLRHSSCSKPTRTVLDVFVTPSNFYFNQIARKRRDTVARLLQLYVSIENSSATVRK